MKNLLKVFICLTLLFSCALSISQDVMNDDVVYNSSDIIDDSVNMQLLNSDIILLEIDKPRVPDNSFVLSSSVVKVDYKYCEYHDAMEIDGPQIPDHGFTNSEIGLSKVDYNYGSCDNKMEIDGPQITDHGFTNSEIGLSKVDYKYCEYHDAMEIVNPQIPDHGYTAYYDMILDINLIDMNGKLSLEVDRPKPPLNGFKSH